MAIPNETVYQSYDISQDIRKIVGTMKNFHQQPNGYCCEQRVGNTNNCKFDELDCQDGRLHGILLTCSIRVTSLFNLSFDADLMYK